MSLDDPIRIVYNVKIEAWTLERGRETFYDNERAMMAWGDPETAAHWAKTQYPWAKVLMPDEDPPKRPTLDPYRALKRAVWFYVCALDAYRLFMIGGPLQRKKHIQLKRAEMRLRSLVQDRGARKRKAEKGNQTRFI